MNKEKTEIVGLRTPVSLKQSIKTIADSESRSITGQILHWLKTAVADHLRDHPELDPHKNPEE